MFASLPHAEEERTDDRRTPVFGIVSTLLGLMSLFVPVFAVVGVPAALICSAVASRRERKGWAVAGALLGILGMVSCFYTAQRVANIGAEFEQSQRDRDQAVRLLRLEGYGWQSERYSTHLVGSVVNGSDKRFSFVHIKFSLLDSDGNLVGTASDMTTTLEPGQRWKFSALVVDGSRVRTVRFAELTGTPQ